MPTRHPPHKLLTLVGLLFVALLAAPMSRPPADVLVRADLTPTQPGDRMSLDDLRELQRRLEEVTQKVLPATVGIRAGMGQGSGVIVSRDGFVLTASHVVADADQFNGRVEIILLDGSVVRGQVLERMNIERNDSALVQIDPGQMPEGGWTFAPVGRSGDLQLGDWTVAIGHPGGYRSDRPPVVRLGRLLQASRIMLVTDNTLVGGDSGGPLFDLSGNVVGIHSRIGESASDNKHVPVDRYTGQWVDFSFADPIVPVIGVQGPVDGPPELQVVSPRGPAARAGLREGDIVAHFNGLPIVTFSQLVEAVLQTRPGDEVEVRVLRPDAEEPFVTQVRIASREEVRRGW